MHRSLTRRFALLGASAVLFALNPGALQTAVATPSKPDIVLIVTDDQRMGTLGNCLPSLGAPDSAPGATPCLPLVKQDLIQHGVTFDLSYGTTSMCCPGRASILTGQYAHHTGVLTNTVQGGYQAFVPHESSTLATWLHAAGYRTGLFGKYLNKYQTTAEPPGWDEWHAKWEFTTVDYWNYTVTDNGVADSFTKTYSTTLFGNEATQFVQQTPANQPLFLYYAPDAPHKPSDPARGDTHAFDAMLPWRPPNYNEADVSDKPQWVQNLPLPGGGGDGLHRSIQDSLLEVDRQVHAIVQALAARGTLSNSLIVFTSDNGLSWGEHRYLDDKFCEFEECHAVPLVIRFDPATGGVAREDVTHIALNIDLAPTIAEAAGLTSFDGMDGRSLLSLLGPSGDVPPGDPPWRTEALGEDFGSLVDAVTPSSTQIRTGPADPLGAWRYVELVTGEKELYDETNDPYELSNVAVASPAPGSVQAQLAARTAALDALSPPTVTFGSGPAAATSSTSASISFSAPETVGGSRLRCSFDGAPIFACPSGSFSATGLSYGTHSLVVIADGHDGTSAATPYTWTIYATPPAPTFTQTPPDPSEPSATFAFTDAEPEATFTCSLDGATATACSSPVTLSGLSASSHTFTVRAVDANAHVSVSTSDTWSVVDSAPTITSLDGPSTPTNQAVASFTFSASDPDAGFSCAVDGGASAACSSPWSTPALADGSHAFSVVATNGGGSSSPSTWTWFVDTHAPSVTISSPVADALLRRKSTTVTWSGTDPAPSAGAVVFSLGQRQGLSGTLAPVYSGSGVSFPVSGLAEGQAYCWQVTGTDPVGNAGSSAVRCAGVPRDDRSLSYVGTTSQSAATAAFDGTLTTLTGPKAEVDVTVTARKVGVLFQKGPSKGKAAIYVDGAFRVTIDLYVSSLKNEAYAWSTTFASVGTHTIRVVRTGTKNSSSTGYNVVIDGAAAIGTVAPSSSAYRLLP